MPANQFDSRQLNAMTLYACQLAIGNYGLAVAEFPGLVGTVNVVAARSDPSKPTSVVFTSDANGKLTFSDDTPAPFTVEEGAYLMFSYFAQNDEPIAYSVQISGAGTQIDSRSLEVGQAFSVPFLDAGDFTYQAYLLTTDDGGTGKPPQFVLKFEGEIRVRDNAIIEEPIVIELDPQLAELPAALTPPTSPVTWEVKAGTWYLVGGPKPQNRRSGR